jgi:hypothetical protein
MIEDGKEPLKSILHSPSSILSGVAWRPPRAARLNLFEQPPFAGTKQYDDENDERRSDSVLNLSFNYNA